MVDDETHILLNIVGNIVLTHHVNDDVLFCDFLKQKYDAVKYSAEKIEKK